LIARYIRENFINVAARKIPNWKYLAWIDAHQIFENTYWWEEAITSSEKYASVQIFHKIVRKNPLNETEMIWESAIHKSLLQTVLDEGEPFYFGNAYIITDELYNKMEYILDTCIATCCDCAYVEASLDEKTRVNYMSSNWPNYTAILTPWINRTKEIFQGRRKSIRGDLYHLWHEHLFDYYKVLFAINDLGFDVHKDIHRDENFTLHLVNQTLKLKFKELLGT